MLFAEGSHENFVNFQSQILCNISIPGLRTQRALQQLHTKPMKLTRLAPCPAMLAVTLAGMVVLSEGPPPPGHPK